MPFLLSLLFAAAFSVLCGKALRKHPAPFYLTAAVLSIGTATLANTRISGVPVFVQQNFVPLFTKGILAAAFWAVVIWTGALPNQSALRKKLLPQRGQLSVFAAILTLGHAVGFLISVFPRWIRNADILNLTVCIVLLLIMLPLTVISVQKIRRKMKAKTWKSVQRWAYLFYALIPVHVIALNLAKARSGRKDVLFSLMLYLAVFLGYAVCRLRKWYLLKKKPERLIGLKLASWGAFLIGMTVFAAAAFPEKQEKTVPTADAAVQTVSAETDTTAIETTTASAQSSETVPASGAESTAADSTAETAEHTSESMTEQTKDTAASAESTAAAELTQRSSQQAQTSQTTTTETKAATQARRWQDGTFTAKAYGYDGDITVHVTIQNDSITDITAETEESDDSYFFDAKRAVIPAIIRGQTAETDACSGATYSSNGIMEAVRKALEQAKL